MRNVPLAQPAQPSSLQPPASFLIFLIALSAAAGASPDGPKVAKVAAVSDRRPVVTVGLGGEAGVQPGDRVAYLRDGKPIAAGTIILVAPHEAGSSLEWTAASPQAGDTAIVLERRLLRSHRRQLPRGTTIHAAISALNPGHAFAWIPVGRSVGLQTGDRFLVWRARVPIARGEAVLTDDRTSLISLVPMVRDLRPAQGDRVTLSPSPFEQTTRRHVAIVLAEKKRGDGQVLVLGTGEPNRFHADDRLDIFRDQAYVGYATVTRSDGLLVEADTVPPLGPMPAAVGDRAERRGPRSTTAHISRMEGEVCLITIGQRDGVQFGQTGHLTADPSVRLTIENVLDEHSVARLTLPASSDAKKPALWDGVRLGDAPSSRPSVLGRLPQKMPVPWLAAVKRAPDGPAVERGTIVRCASSPPAAALVIHVDPHHVVLYCPEAWRGGSVAGYPVAVHRPAGPLGGP